MYEIVTQDRFIEAFNCDSDMVPAFTKAARHVLFDYLDGPNTEETIFYPLAIADRYKEFASLAEYNAERGEHAETLDDICKRFVLLEIPRSTAFIIDTA